MYNLHIIFLLQLNVIKICVNHVNSLDRFAWHRHSCSLYQSKSWSIVWNADYIQFRGKISLGYIYINKKIKQFINTFLLNYLWSQMAYPVSWIHISQLADGCWLLTSCCWLALWRKLGTSTEDWWITARRGAPKRLRRDFDTFTILVHWRIWKERKAMIFHSETSTIDRIFDLIIDDLHSWRVVGCIIAF